MNNENGDYSNLFTELLRYCDANGKPRSMNDCLVAAVTAGTYTSLDELEEVDEFCDAANARDAAQAIVSSVADALYGKAVA